MRLLEEMTDRELIAATIAAGFTTAIWENKERAVGRMAVKAADALLEELAIVSKAK